MDKLNASVQCIAKCNTGKQCSRRTKSANKLCYYHKLAKKCKQRKIYKNLLISNMQNTTTDNVYNYPYSEASSLPLMPVDVLFDVPETAGKSIVTNIAKNSKKYKRECI